MQADKVRIKVGLTVPPSMPQRLAKGKNWRTMKDLFVSPWKADLNANVLGVPWVHSFLRTPRAPAKTKSQAAKSQGRRGNPSMTGNNEP